ncbi:MAG: glycerate kinase [Myxococcota bacterium]
MTGTILCAPDSLKGVLSAAAAASALARGVARSAVGLAAHELPLADGGEGTADALHASLGGAWRTAVVSDPLGRPVEARWLALPGGRAVVESARAIGLPLLAEGERDPLRATSRGLGELVLAAVREGASELLVTLGGSATVDGGAGLLEALDGRAPLGVPVRVACDVTNPLLGPRGAARAFGPQKGATPEVVEELERRLAARSELAQFADLPGAGAAGGLGAAFAALGAELVPGSELVLDALDFARRAGAARLVVTGEGAVDATSAEGKAPAGVARACARLGVPCVVFGGRVEPAGRALYALGATAILPLSGRVERAADDLVDRGEALARLVTCLGGIEPDDG